MHSADSDRLGPLWRQRSFSGLWAAWLIANLCIWMADVAAAWLMTSLTESKFMVAMVQTCTALPVFLFALPAGTLADRINRRHGFLMAQAWATSVLVAIGLLSVSGALSSGLLLVMVFASGMATALRWPVFSALVPEVVPRESLPQAISMNSIAINLSRLAGPMLAGVLVAAWGGGSVFAVCAVLALVSAALVARFGERIARGETPEAPPEPWARAMRAGPTHIWGDPYLRANCIRGVTFFFIVTAMLGLLPSLARELGAGGPQVYATLFACMGAGAVAAGFLVHGWRRRTGYTALMNTGGLALGLSVLVVAWTEQVWLSCVAMLLLGIAWMGVGNTLNTAAQMRLPDALRARCMSVYFMGGMAGGATGAACLGALADGIGLRPALAVLGVLTLAVTLLAWRRLPITDMAY